MDNCHHCHVEAASFLETPRDWGTFLETLEHCALNVAYWEPSTRQGYSESCDNQSPHGEVLVFS